VNLVAEGLRLADDAREEGYVYLNVDQCPRAFVYRATLPRHGVATTPHEELQPALRLVAPPLALSGPNLTVGLEVDQAPAGAMLEVELGSKQGSTFSAELSQRLAAPRQERIGCSPFGLDGALLLSAAVRDWQVCFDAEGIAGQRWLHARLIASDGRTVCIAEQPIVLDNTPPTGVQLIDPPARVAKGVPLQLIARGIDELSGISQATFFIGQPAEGKLPAGTLTVAGKSLDGAGTQWSAALELPPEAKGPLTVGVQLTNGVGLASLATATIEISDAATLALGKIRGSVLEGPRPQAGLEVVLKDEHGKELAKTKTDDNGTFLFDKVTPGKHTISASKPASLRKAESSVTVEPAGTAAATLRLEM
jgi:hypothetical protein